MRIISAQQADAVMTWPAMVEALKAGHRLPQPTLRDQYTEPADAPHFLYTRSAYIPGIGYGSKVVSVYFDNPKRSAPLPAVQGGVLLFDDATGVPLAVVDGACETKWKTVGDSLLGASLLANPSPKQLTTVGAGAISAAAIDGYRAVFPSLERVVIWNRSPGRGEALAANKDAVFTSDLPAAVANADIVCAATIPTEPLIDGDWLKPGCHLDLIGAHKPPHREAMDSAIIRAELFVDSYETAIDDVGELRIPIQQGLITRSDIRGDLYALCADSGVGRSGPEAITLFKNGGGGHLDLMTARAIYDATT